MKVHVLAASILLASCSVDQSSDQLVRASVRSTAQPFVVLDHCPYGCPAGATTNRILAEHDIFTLSFNTSTHFSDWISYEVNRETIGRSLPRNYVVDPLVEAAAPGQQVLDPHYDGAFGAIGYERGHLAILTAFTNLHENSWKKANYVSNLAPQCSALNHGPWRSLEKREHVIAGDREPSLFVATGTLYFDAMPPLPNAPVSDEGTENHIVPSGFWRVVAQDGPAGVEVAAFIFDQASLMPNGCKRNGTPQPDPDHCEHMVPLGEVERASRLDLLPHIDGRTIRDSYRVATDLGAALECDPS